jgi:hypothetical protein
MADNNSIPASALPPGAGPDYIKQMVARAEQGGSDFGNAPTPSDFSPPMAPQFQTKAGFSRAAAAATADDVLVIDHGGQQITVEVSQAVKSGLIRPAAGGGFEAIPTAERQRAEEAQRQQEQQELQKVSEEREALRATGDEPPRELQAAIDRANASVPGQVITGFVEDFVSHGSLDYGQFVRATRSVGLDAQRAEAMATGLVEGFRQQADLAVMTRGIPASEADALYQWAAEHHPADHKNAVRALVLASDAKPLKALALKYAAFKRGGDV